MRGAQHSAGTGAGEAWTGGRVTPAPSRSPRRACGGHPPGVSCPCDQTVPAHAALPQRPRLPPHECGRAGHFLSSLFFVSFQCHSKREEKEIKKKKGSNSGLFAKVQKSRGEGTPPRPGEKISSAFSDPAWPPSLPGPHLTQTLPRGDVPLPRGHRPPGGPSPRPPCWL